MRFLLDTHVLLWWLADDKRLPSEYRDLIGDGRNLVYVSSVSVAEVSIKASLGKLHAPEGIVEASQQSGFELLSLSPQQAEVLRHLPWLHRDPFDRMLIAQAMAEGLSLLTVDQRIRRYEGLSWR